MFNKAHKKSDPHWLSVIKETIKTERMVGGHHCYGYVPVGQEKLLMSLPNEIMFNLEMRVENDDGAEYYYRFIF